MLEALAAAVGLALVVVTLADVFASVVVPRAVGGRYRFSVLLSRHGWKLWRAAALRIRDAERREDTLGSFAPMILVLDLGLWVSFLVVGYGLVAWSLHAQITGHLDVATAFYYAGTTLLTIGYGDIVPAGPLARVLSVVSAMSGLAVLAITTTYLFQIFGAFQRREAFVVAMSERTGSPPSGIELLVRHLKLDLVGDLDGELRETQRWIAEVMETHLAYPILSYFRSSHDDESWVGTLGAFMDAATLLLTTVDIGHRGQAEITLRLATHFTHDVGGFFSLPEHVAPGIDRTEFDLAYETLAALGTRMHPVDAAWAAFDAKRSSYIAPLDALATWFRIPPARWIGDRSRPRIHVNAGLR